MTQHMKLDSVAQFVAKYRTGMLQIISKHIIFNCTYTSIVEYNLGRKKTSLVNWYCYSQIVVYVLWDKRQISNYC